MIHWLSKYRWGFSSLHKYSCLSYYLLVKSDMSASEELVLLSSLSNSISSWMESSVTAFSHSSRSAERIIISPDLQQIQHANINIFYERNKCKSKICLRMETAIIHKLINIKQCIQDIYKKVFNICRVMHLVIILCLWTQSLEWAHSKYVYKKKNVSLNEGTLGENSNNLKIDSYFF